MSDHTFFMTTPLYYVNDKPHIGHAYSTILADVITRYQKMAGRPTYWLTGTDEHGQKMVQAASKAGRTTQAHCDELSQSFRELWVKLGIENDYFIRTTGEDHRRVVQHALQQLFDQGDIEKAEYNGWYCVPCERFWTEKDLVDQKCPDCHREVQPLSEINYFFRMSRYQTWLIDHIQNHPGFIVPESRRNEVLGFLRQPLNDLCISRPVKRLNWGIPLPFDTDYICYVWFDALLGYATGAGYMADPERFNQVWPANYHLMAKDILTTHAVYWPIMLKALGIELPHAILAHGWWLIDDTKMSKSLGNVVKPLDLADRYGIDPFRYFLIREMTLGQDANFSEEVMIDRINSDLANDLGNLVNRINKMAINYLQGRLHRSDAGLEADQHLVNLAVGLKDRIAGLLAGLKLNLMIEETLQVIRAINKYLEETAPWKLAKQDRMDRINQILYTAVNVLRMAAGYLHPVMPAKMAEVYSSLGLPNQRESFRFECLGDPGWMPDNLELTESRPLFPRIEKPEVSVMPEAVSKAPVSEADNAGMPAGLISLDEFGKVDLRVVEIVQAAPLAGSDKLLKLKVRIGETEKQVLAGIAKDYQSESLIGKRVIMVNNLKPAKIRGEMSEGMLLAARNRAGELSLIIPEKPGFAGERLS
ncbi:MAG: methionine--tRNA ligase [Candidatus Delongbacteria bacterium]|nr:methionine--tRNA ligase [Candidatus Delongbacteria bacterium]